MKVVDLYSGLGGLSLGLKWAGLDVVGAIDRWPFVVELYRMNFNQEVLGLDISQNKEQTISFIKNKNAEVIVGGPPCQDFSSAGKSNEKLARANETLVFAEIIQSCMPRYFVMENVERVLNSEKFKIVSQRFKKIGYGLNQRVLDAKFCGVPQKRKRLFLIGKLHEKSNFLDKYIDKKIARKAMTVKDYFGESLDLDHYYRHPRNYSRRAIFSTEESSPTIRGVNRTIPMNYQIHPGDTEKDLKKVRSLTTMERAYIQTFPKSFKLTGPNTYLEQALGNAVPVKMAQLIGDCLLQFEKDNS